MDPRKSFQRTHSEEILCTFARQESVLGHGYWASWQQWFLISVLAHLVVTPAILYGVPGVARALAVSDPKRWLGPHRWGVRLVVTFLFPK